MTYFSDKELTYKDKLVNEITVDVWNGIGVIINKLIASNLLAKDYPAQCPDGNGICGVNEQNLYIAAIAVIPQLKNMLPEYGPINSLPQDYFDNPFALNVEDFTYGVLDFIEFIYKHIYDVQNGDYHTFFKHYELNFPNTTNSRMDFISNVNEIFERNHIGFNLKEDGNIQRIIVKELVPPYDKKIEQTFNELLDDAICRFRNPKIEERQIAIEKLWDAFERIKTLLIPVNKKESVECLLDKVASGEDSIKQILDQECKILTGIGNALQIRHFEMDKVQIKSEEHIDYLFYRMYSFLQLLSNAI